MVVQQVITQDNWIDNICNAQKPSKQYKQNFIKIS